MSMRRLARGRDVHVSVRTGARGSRGGEWPEKCRLAGERPRIQATRAALRRLLWATPAMASPSSSDAHTDTCICGPNPVVEDVDEHIYCNGND